MFGDALSSGGYSCVLRAASYERRNPGLFGRGFLFLRKGTRSQKLLEIAIAQVILGNA